MALGDGTAWDESAPTNANKINLGDDEILDLRKGIRIRLEYEHATLGAASAGGKHKFVTLQEQATKPTVDSTQKGAVYIKAVSGADELFYEDEAGNEIQITSGNALNADTTSDYPNKYLGEVYLTWKSNTAITLAAGLTVKDDGDSYDFVPLAAATDVDLSASGANGLDTGSEAASTMYYVWIIAKSADNTTAGLFSTSATAPTMPSGYDKKRLIMAVRNNASSNIEKFTMNGWEISYDTPPTIDSGSSASLAAWDTTTITAYYPSAISKLVFGTLFHQDNGVYVGNDSSIAINIGTTFNYNNTIGFHSSGATPKEMMYWRLPVLTANTLYYASNDSNGTLRIGGFVINPALL